MSHCTIASVTITTDASGNATAYTNAVNGLLSQIRYVKNDYDNGVDFTVTNETTGEAIWTGTDVNASTTVAPRQATVSVANAAALYAAAGTAVNDLIAIPGHRIKIVVAQGGNVKSGTLHFILR
jgi:hypothetical protein